MFDATFSSIFTILAGVPFSFEKKKKRTKCVNQMKKERKKNNNQFACEHKIKNEDETVVLAIYVRQRRLAQHAMLCYAVLCAMRESICCCCCCLFHL